MESVRKSGNKKHIWKWQGSNWNGWVVVMRSVGWMVHVVGLLFPVEHDKKARWSRRRRYSNIKIVKAISIKGTGTLIDFRSAQYGLCAELKLPSTASTRRRAATAMLSAGSVEVNNSHAICTFNSPGCGRSAVNESRGFNIIVPISNFKPSIR